MCEGRGGGGKIRSMEEEEDDGLEYLMALDAFIEDGTGGFLLRDKLAERGAPLPPLESLNDAELSRALTDAIWGLYDLGVLVETVDHLSDRELYKEIVEYCSEPTITFPNDPYSNTHWSPIGSCTEEDMAIYNRYYADERQRQDWAREFPEEPMPPSELPPYPRPWIPDMVPRTKRREEIEP